MWDNHGIGDTQGQTAHKDKKAAAEDEGAAWKLGWMILVPHPTAPWLAAPSGSPGGLFKMVLVVAQEVLSTVLQ